MSVMRKNKTTTTSSQGRKVEQCNMSNTILRDKHNVQHVYHCQKCLCLFDLGQREKFGMNTLYSLEENVFQKYALFSKELPLLRVGYKAEI